jgi:sugar-specific transcriptional regulator TrmB
MKKSDIKNNLEIKLLDYGLTPKEAHVYVAALELGTATVQEIATKAGTERTNAYDVVNSLIKKRLMSITTLGKRNQYVAESPEALEQIIEQKRFELKDFIPELRSIHNVAETTPRVRFYPGIEGFKAVYEDILTCREKKMLGIFAMEDFLAVAGQEFLDQMVEARVRKGINLRVIRSREQEVEDIYLSSELQLRDLRYAPEGMVFPITSFVYDNKVIYLSSKKETFGLIIESKDIAEAHKNYFLGLWQISEPQRKL